MYGITSRSMRLLSTVWQHPRRLKVRRAVFQIHLWTGLALSLWVILIGLSGSVLVFEEDLSRAMLPAVALPPFSEQVDLPLALQSAQKVYPQAVPFYVTAPDTLLPFFTIWMHNGTHRSDLVLTADARTGQILPSRHPVCVRMLEKIHDFHFYLLLGETGLRINAVLSAALLLAISTGLLLWWPGIRLWQRGLRVSVHHAWKRINFDLHHAVGFWTLCWSLCWAVSGIYIGFPASSQRIIGWLAPIRAMQPPTPTADHGATQPPSLAAVLAKAHQQSPGAFLSGVSLPVSADSPYVVTIDTKTPGDFSHRDIVTISARSGQILSVWHYGQNRTLADSFLWALYGLHFGTLWGTTWKIVWALAGMSLPILAVTGCLMYWNRFLRKILT